MNNENICKLAPSMLSCDFSNVAKGVELINTSNADYIHLDVMDGQFVPNISFGPKFIKDMRLLSSLPFDTHLMVNNPDLLIPAFVEAGSDIITVHSEASIHLHRTIGNIHQHGIKAGISIVPSTEVSTIFNMLHEIEMVLVMSVNPGFGGQQFINFSYEKIKELASYREKHNLDFLISVDGGITTHNAAQIYNSGADILVMGTSFFYAKDSKELVSSIHELKRT
ncbi:MAG: ribulose-phosphate 3-epimerase [Spirochaetia bacterium]|nr:ribulose-phosphate 3-epimerase [Spirochaetia bacterium]